MSSPTKPPKQEDLGLIDEILCQLPLWCRNHIIFNWAPAFVPGKTGQDVAIVEMFGTMTMLNFYRSQIDEAKFLTLAYLPFSDRLSHLNLSKSSIGESPALLQLLAHPIFQHLITLDLSSTQTQSLDSFFSAPLPNLRSLDISQNPGLSSIPSITAFAKLFPQLNALNILNIRPFCYDALSSPVLVDPVIDTTSAPINPSPQPLLHLEKFQLGNHNMFTTTPPLPLSHLSHLKEFRLKSDNLHKNALIKTIFDQTTSPLKNLTVLDLSQTSLDGDTLKFLGESPLLSNLTTLKLDADISRPSSLFPLTQSKFLWNPTLKHLELGYFDDSLNASSDLATAFEEFNVQLETFCLKRSIFSLDILSTSPCFSQLKKLDIRDLNLNEAFPKTNQDDINQQSNGDADGEGEAGIDLGDNNPQLKSWRTAWERLLQSPNFSKLTHFTLPTLYHNNVYHRWTKEDLISLLTSPMMSNNLIELDFQVPGRDAPIITDDVIEAIFTARVIPGDETTPLKFGQVEKMKAPSNHISSRGISIIVQNLTKLTHLDLSRGDGIDDVAVSVLVGPGPENPYYPYPTLPNLIHLNLNGCQISLKNRILLSKPPLMDQFEFINFSDVPFLGLFINEAIGW